MTIPPFTIDGILPPFLGDGPSRSAALMSPYRVTATEVVTRFATTEARIEILKGWLGHRAALRGLGIIRGFQWLDGSFLEEKEPNDLDIVVFTYRPPTVPNAAAWAALVADHPDVFNRSAVKTAYKLDSAFLDLDGRSETLVSMSRYYLQLFSHQRVSFLWKGMLQVRLEDDIDDLAALSLLSPTAIPLGGQP